MFKVGYDYEKTHELILKSAMKNFEQKGYSGASIRQICKDAGVTNGAFYSHYENKEELFIKLVDPVIRGLNDLYSEEGSAFMQINDAKELDRVLKRTFDSDKMLIRYIYANSEVFRLILTSSEGTKYQDLTARIAEEETDMTLSFLEGCKKLIKKPENISEVILKQMSSFVVNTVFNCFIEGNSEEETIRQTRLASEFCITGLKKILGI